MFKNIFLLYTAIMLPPPRTANCTLQQAIVRHPSTIKGIRRRHAITSLLWPSPPKAELSVVCGEGSATFCKNWPLLPPTAARSHWYVQINEYNIALKCWVSGHCVRGELGARLPGLVCLARNSPCLPSSVPRFYLHRRACPAIYSTVSTVGRSPDHRGAPPH